MEIFPENLGPVLEAEVQSVRAARRKADQDEAPFPSLSTLKAALLFGTLLTVILWFFQSVGWAVLVTLTPAWLLFQYFKKAQAHDPFAFLVYRNGSTARIPQKPLTSYEIQEQQRFWHDPLLRTYLDLATGVISATAPDAAAEHEVRSALQALGTTVLALPADDPKTIGDDPMALRAEAAKLESDAQAEPDAVIGASLHRRAESLTRRADTAARTLLLLRRNQALRQETGEQMDALRTSLTAFRVGGRQSAPELAELAASIQRVAQEANAITAARTEVDTLLTRPLANATIPPVGETQAQAIRR